ncbi:hypothetical protein LTS18_000832, partial [Coniosporium uncinatum]
DYLEDMFVDEPTHTASGHNKAVPVSQAQALDANLLDNWDDKDGYYCHIPGELIDGRYEVGAVLGRGIFAQVIRAKDKVSGNLVAIKIVRSNETMKRAGLKEIDILGILRAEDPDDKKHIVRLHRHFEHKNHLCMVFENLNIDLREVIKRHGRVAGINIKAVRGYAIQLFQGLSLMKKSSIIHADLKPDNVLVTESLRDLKICDLGSATYASDTEITPYLVSRFYRAPEVILGMNPDFAIDMWSIGCTLFELYTGKILFPGRSNNQMLKAIIDARGNFPLKMLKKAELAGLHFEDNGKTFRSNELDKFGRETVRNYNYVRSERDLKTRLSSYAKGLSYAEKQELNLFIDLLDKCLALNPEKRLTPNDALKHPFISRTK